MVVAIFSYLTLITPVEQRTLHLTMVEGSIGLGVLIGVSLNGVIIDDLGLDTLTYITVLIAIPPLLIAILFVRNATQARRSPSTTYQICSQVLSLRSVTDALSTITKKRKGFKRCLLSLTFVLYFFPLSGEETFESVSFLYFVKELGFTMTEYSVFNAGKISIICFGGPLVIILVKRFLNPDDLTFALGSCAVTATAFIIMSQPEITGSIWFGGIFLITQVPFSALVKTIQTKLCEEDELGKLFAFVAIMQSVISTVFGVVGKLFYTTSLSVWPSSFIAFTALMYVAAMIIICIMSYVHDRHVRICLLAETNEVEKLATG